MRPHLPPSNDEYWQTGDEQVDMYKVDMSLQPTTTCKECVYQLDAPAHTAVCKMCGRGFYFRPDLVEVKGDKLIDLVKHKQFTIEVVSSTLTNV